MSPFKKYPLMCPKCGSEKIQGEGARGERYLYFCLDCHAESWNRAYFKKERVLKMKRWKEAKPL